MKWVAIVLAIFIAAAGQQVAALDERVCAGGDTLHGVAAEWARLLEQLKPDYRVRITTEAKLSADGFSGVRDGTAICALFVRELFASEQAAFFARFGYEPLLIPVGGGSYATKGGTHAIAIYVNAANPLERLTLAQLRDVFTGAASRWGDLGVGGAWATRPIALYGMLRARQTGDPPGIVNYLQNRVMGGASFRPDLNEQKDSASEGALSAIVRHVAEDTSGIGYSGFGFAQPGTKTLLIAENARGPFLAGTSAEVADRSYPLSRLIYVLVNRAPSQPIDPVIGAYIDVALSAAGQKTLVQSRTNFLPLTDSERRHALSLIAPP
ncbi:MAG: substrate-binding domain-containing protein [Rhodospirillaceae bacterium]|nr:substrate-binding domain-containing protein [Rhodospirillaceae bacterium]